MSAEINVKLGLAAFAVVAGLFAQATHATTFTWQGDGADATGEGVPAPDPDEVLAGELPFKDWNDPANWDQNALPTINDDIIFAVPTVVGAMNVAYNAPVAAKSIFVVQQTTPLHYEVLSYGLGRMTLAAGGNITLDNNTPAIPFTGNIDLNGNASIIGGAVASSFNFQGATLNGLAAGTTLTVNPNSGTASAVGTITGPINFVRNSTGGALSFFGQSTYTGSTAISGGTTIAKVNNTLPSTTVLTLGNGATTGVLRLDFGVDLTVAGLVNAGTSITANGINANSTVDKSVVTVNATQYSSFNGRLGASGAASQFMDFVKTGPAAFTFANSVHTITGSVSVLGGTLEVEGTGNFQNASGITINGGRLMWASSAALTRPVTLTSGTIGGTGNINTAITVGANGTVSPGGNVDGTGVVSDTIAAQNYQAGLTFGPDGTYHYDVDAATGDTAAVSGAGLGITATSSDKFAVEIASTGLTPGAPYTRTIATSSAAITDFSADKFGVTGRGAGSVALQDPNTLVVNFNAAESVYWDTNGTTAGGGGATPGGNWNGAATNFNTDSTGGAGGSTTATTAAYNDVVFAAATDGGGTYTVNVSGTQSALSVDVARGNVTLAGGTIATGLINVASGATATVSSAVAGGPLGSVTKTGPGTLTITSINSYTGGTNVNVGTLEVKKMHAGNAVNVAAGATLRVLESSPGVSSGHPSGDNAFVSQPSSLTVAPGAFLDITNNDIVIDYTGASPVAAYEALVASAYNVTGDWQGDGITSSIAANDGNYVVAIADNATLAAPFGTAQGGPLFAGVDVDLDTVLIKFTHRADINLDGVVTPDDSAVFGGNYDENQPATWATGDMNYDGIFTPDDAAIFGGAYDESLASLPEPSAAVLSLGLMALGLGKRSRKARA